MSLIVTGDKTWAFQYEPESKEVSIQYHKKGTTPPKKSQSAGKLMAMGFWDLEGIFFFFFIVVGTVYAIIAESI